MNNYEDLRYNMAVQENTDMDIQWDDILNKIREIYKFTFNVYNAFDNNFLNYCTEKYGPR